MVVQMLRLPQGYGILGVFGYYSAGNSGEQSRKRQHDERVQNVEKSMAVSHVAGDVFSREDIARGDGVNEYGIISQPGKGGEDNGSKHIE